MLNEDGVVRFLNTKVIDVTGRGKYEGMLFGVELELEGRNVGLEGVASKNWKRHVDGSLRGEAMEYVFAAPCEYEEARARVQRLFDVMKKNGVRFNNSYRTSTHIHLNFLDKTIKQLINFFLIHTVLEEVFEYYCGEDRKGNLFCMSARDNEELIRIFDKAVFQHANLRDFNDDKRYIAANVCSVNKFGSMEIRTMRGANTAQEVLDWMDILNQLYVYCCKEDCPSPARMAENLSYLGPEGFLRQFFNEKALKNLLASWPAPRDLRMSLLEGVRLIQMFAYKLDDYWNKEAPKGVAKTSKTKINIADAFRIEEPLLREGNDAIHLTREGIGRWFVFLQGEPRNEIPAPVGGNWIRYNADEDCWFYCNAAGAIDYMAPIRWLTYDGNPVPEGTARDRRVNRLWYEINEPEEDDEDGPDWNEE